MARFVETGAFGYSGTYIARRLLDLGHEVHTITDSPDRENPFDGKVRIGRPEPKGGGGRRGRR